MSVFVCVLQLEQTNAALQQDNNVLMADNNHLQQQLVLVNDNSAQVTTHQQHMQR
jgi:hypothetical protein